MKLHASLISLLCLISLVAMPLASFAGQPSGGTSTPTVGFGGTAIPGGNQSTSYVISASGSYYLAGERVMTAPVAAITVSAPDVTIDLNGGTIRYTTADAAPAGILIQSCSNVEIRNGSLTDVPANAIYVLSGVGLRVKNVRVTTCTGSAVVAKAGNATFENCDFTYAGNWGIQVLNSEGARVVNCTIAHNAYAGVGFGSVANGEVSSCSIMYNGKSGIESSGEGCLFANNVIARNNILSKQTSNAGIFSGKRSVIRGNVLDSNYQNGVFTQGPSVIEGNTITNTLDSNNTLTNAWAIHCLGLGSLSVNNRTSSGSLLDPILVNGGGNLQF